MEAEDAATTNLETEIEETVLFSLPCWVALVVWSWLRPEAGLEMWRGVKEWTASGMMGNRWTGSSIFGFFASE